VAPPLGLGPHLPRILTFRDIADGLRLPAPRLGDRYVWRAPERHVLGLASIDTGAVVPKLEATTLDEKLEALVAVPFQVIYDPQSIRLAAKGTEREFIGRDSVLGHLVYQPCDRAIGRQTRSHGVAVQP
jgi:hypothetical protein